jgi:hypothetical protein
MGMVTATTVTVMLNTMATDQSDSLPPGTAFRKVVGPSAIYLALDLLRNPILAGVMQQHPLPGGVLEVIKIAAGSKEAMRTAAEATGKDTVLLRRAAIFYVRQVLWARDADCYRSLGLPQGADQKELAAHLRWLMKWLHPDRGPAKLTRRHDAERVLRAWEELKTPERRRRYDQSLMSARSPRRQKRRQRGSRSLPLIPFVGPEKRDSLGEKARIVWVATFIAIAATAAAVVLLLPDWAAGPL